MSHHFKAKGGTVFNFNSDLSGDVRVHLRTADIVDPHTAVAEFPASDLLEFVDWYRRTPGYGVDEEALSETLTEEERELLLHAPELLSGQDVCAKLLRLHDALQARVKELESAASTWAETTGARIRELETRVKELEALRDRVERLRDGLSFDGGWEEGERVVLTRILNGQDPD